MIVLSRIVKGHGGQGASFSPSAQTGKGINASISHAIGKRSLGMMRGGHSTRG
jgi:hypothetical protein